MKRLGGVWPQLVSFDNLLLAFRKARRGKARRPSVAAFELHLEKKLLQLQRELQNGEYQPGEYRVFTIYERKPREISAAPFRDRVVHHAIINQNSIASPSFRQGLPESRLQGSNRSQLDWQNNPACTCWRAVSMGRFISA